MTYVKCIITKRFFTPGGVDRAKHIIMAHIVHFITRIRGHIVITKPMKFVPIADRKLRNDNQKETGQYGSPL